MYLAMGVLAATIEAQRSGQGQIVDAAMIDGVVHLMSAFQAFRQCGTWTSERGENIVDGGAHFYGTYKTQDGKYIALGAIEPHFYAALIQVLGLDHSLLPDQNDRKTWPKMRTQFATIFLTKTRDEWVQIMAGREACFSPVLSIDEAPQHPQMQQRDVFQKFDGVLHPSPAPRFSKTPGALRRPAPAPGQHSEEVLAEWGLTADEINSLQEVGAMHQACRTS
jgi:alpha-methylacyl-CoA racemase